MVFGIFATSESPLLQTLRGDIHKSYSGTSIKAYLLLKGLRSMTTLKFLIDVGQGISVGPGRFGKKNKRRALNKRRVWKIWKKE